MNALLLLLLLPLLVEGCVYKEEKYKDGETWLVRGSFVMKCFINKDGSWTARVVGCRTKDGTQLLPGQNTVEGDTLYTCAEEQSGGVKLTRAENISKACEGHPIGESWTSKKNFRKECTATGARIVSCLTDNGETVALNSRLVVAGVIYTCTTHENGTVTVNRESVPAKTNLGKPGAKAVLAKPAVTDLKVEDGTSTVAPLTQAPTQEMAETESTHSNTTPSPIPNPPPVPVTTALPVVTCFSEGAVRQPEETWIVDGRFTKKCTGRGSTLILNCLIDLDSTINVDSEVVIDNKKYKCSKSEDGSVLFEVRPL